MKEYIKGIITGLSITIALFLFVGAQQKKGDSLNTIMGQLDTYVKDQLDKDKAAGRFSFNLSKSNGHIGIICLTQQQLNFIGLNQAEHPETLIGCLLQMLILNKSEFEFN
mgnify:CR=1 FL=1